MRVKSTVTKKEGGGGERARSGEREEERGKEI